MLKCQEIFICIFIETSCIGCVAVAVVVVIATTITTTTKAQYRHEKRMWAS